MFSWLVYSLKILRPDYGTFLRLLGCRLSGVSGVAEGVIQPAFQSSGLFPL